MGGVTEAKNCRLCYCKHHMGLHTHLLCLIAATDQSLHFVFFPPQKENRSQQTTFFLFFFLFGPSSSVSTGVQKSLLHPRDSEPGGHQPELAAGSFATLPIISKIRRHGKFFFPLYHSKKSASIPKFPSKSGSSELKLQMKVTC